MNSDVWVQSLKDYLSEILHCESYLLGFEQFIKKQYAVQNYMTIESFFDILLSHKKSLELRLEQLCDQMRQSKHQRKLYTRPGYPRGYIPPLDPTLKWSSLSKEEPKQESESDDKYYEDDEDDDGNRNFFVGNIKSTEFQIETINTRLNQIEKDPAYMLYRKTKDVLFKLYAMNIVHPKYHNIIAISSIYEYIDTGQTFSLVRSGNDPGAYYLYEEDVRANKIINAIDVGFSSISSQLSTIQKNQYYLYLAVQESNKILQRRSSELSIANKTLQGISNKFDQRSTYDFETSYMMSKAIANTSFFAEETARNSKLLVDINRDKWGILLNRAGHVVRD